MMLAVSTIMGEMPWLVFAGVMLIGVVSLMIWRDLLEELLVRLLLKIRKRKDA